MQLTRALATQVATNFYLWCVTETNPRSPEDLALFAMFSSRRCRPNVTNGSKQATLTRISGLA